ncbi:MAG: hypothetical protein HRU30_03890 [Rhodobacteraceae bacterium]|nr:hypothetical protein [Paracoccaceae bacterium]
MLYVDFESLAFEIMDDIGTFGFQSLTNLLPNSDAQTTLLVDDIPIEEIGFIDPVHFTSQLHEIFAGFQAHALGTEQLDGTDGKEVLYGGGDNQTIFAHDGNDVAFGGSGNDLIFAGEGDDRAYGNAGDDVVFAGHGDDVAFGGAGSDLVSSGSGDDVVKAGSGNDAVAGNAGDDFVSGGLGDDLIFDGSGSDHASGGKGDDVFIYRAEWAEATDEDVFLGGLGDDTLLIVASQTVDDVAAFMDDNNLTAVSVENIEVITAAELADYDFGTLAGVAESADLFGFM